MRHPQLLWITFNDDGSIEWTDDPEELKKGDVPYLKQSEYLGEMTKLKRENKKLRKRLRDEK
jgi:hypothetical protein